METCDVIVITDQYDMTYVENVITETTPLQGCDDVTATSYRYFVHKHFKYVYEESAGMFMQLSGLAGEWNVFSLLPS